VAAPGENFGRSKSGDGPWIDYTVQIVTGRVDGIPTFRPMHADTMVDVWRPIIDPAPLAEANTDRRAEMRAYIKAANAAVVAAGRTPVAA
jgi:hypothetical protein